MRAHPVVWTLRLSWLALPFTLGDAVARATDGRSTAVGIVVAVLGWVVWGAVLVASMVAHPIALTVVRVLAPVAPAAAIAALIALDGEAVVVATLGLVAAIVATVAALSGALADDYVDGASYGDERRFALRVPVSFRLGPIPVFWLLAVGGCLVGPVLLAARQWAGGVLLTAVGLAVAVPAAKSFHALSRRWLVFVPAGVTLIDHLGLIDPVLFPSRRIASLGPALAGSTATDLTQQAPGLVLELAFDSPVEAALRTSREGGDIALLDAVLVSPTRPGAVVAEATRRSVGQRVTTPPPTTSSPS